MALERVKKEQPESTEKKNKKPMANDYLSVFIFTENSVDDS